MKKHYLTNLLPLATLLLLLATAMPSFAQDVDPADEPTAPESYQPTLPKNDAGFYVIASDSDYETFREIVASGNPYANAVLTADITVRNPIGSGDEHVHYRGTFDGQGHTVKIWGDAEDRETYSYSGLFDNTKPGCIIRNLHVTGNVGYDFSVSKSTHLGSIVNDATGTVIENCISDASVLAGSIKRGGLVGIARGECFIENSAFIGGLQVGSEQRCGLVGENSQALSLKSCYVAPDFGQYSKNFHEPTVITDNVDISQNNYYTYRYVDRSYGNNIDKVELELPDYATEVSNDDIRNGNLCDQLNKGGKKGNAWYQNGDYPYPLPVAGSQAAGDSDSDVTEMHNIGDNVEVENIQFLLFNGGKAIVRGITSQTQKAVHIPETIRINGEDWPVIEISREAFKGNTAIEYCYIPKTVASVQEYAFSGCTNLKYVHIADGDYCADKEASEQKALWFDNYSFDNCTSLEKVYIGRDMKWAKNNGGPFASCYEKIAYIYWGANVSYVGNLNEKGDSESETPIPFHIGNEGANGVFFLGNGNSLDNTVNVCSSSTLCKVKSFYINRNVQGMNLSSEDGTGGGMLDGCEAVVFGPSVKSIAAKAFEGTEASPKPLKIADISNAYNLETVGEDAFYCCANLTSSLPFNITKLSSLGKRAFAGSGITDVAFSNYLTEIPEAAFLACKNLGGAYIPASIETIGSAAFSASGLNRVIIEDSAKELDLTKKQFYGCTGINNVYLGRNIKLDEHNIPQDVYSFIPSAGSIWAIGGKVTRLPDHLFNYEKYEGISFLYSEEPLHFSDYANTTAKVITLDRGLVCDKDGKEALPFIESKKVKIECVNFGGNITKIPESMFEDCVEVRNLVIPDNITEIEENAFNGCESVDVVCIMGKASVGESAFAYCSELKYLYLMGDTITLADKAFHDCIFMEEIIPIFTKDPGTGSSATAFDERTYANAKLSVDKSVMFETDPWKKFQKKGLVTATDITNGDLDNVAKLYDRASIHYELTGGQYEFVRPPFEMDSYYFGVDAEIYRMEEKEKGATNYFCDDFTAGVDEKTFDIDNILFNRIDIDTEKKLTPNNAYLIKSNYSENTLHAFNNLFENEKISISTGKQWRSEETNMKTLMYAGNLEGLFEKEKNVFIINEGVIKLYNGGDYEVASLAGVAFNRRKANLDDDENKPIAYNFMSDKSVILSSKIDIPFKTMLDGYASFYAAGYNYIAPEWCDVYIVTSADGESVTLEKIEDRTITKGQAVLLKSNNEEKLADGLTEYLTYATSGSEYSYAGNLLKGVDVETPVSDLGREFVYVLSKTAGNGTGFYKYDKPLLAGKAYLDPESLSPQQLAKSCLLTFNDVVTDIKSVQTTNRTQGIYDLMGRRLQDAGFKGIYIVNGKKVVIK